MDQLLIDIYTNLSEFERSQMYYSIKESVSVDVSIFMTVLFGFIGLAHFSEKGLSRVQLLTISSIYSFFIFFFIWTIGIGISSLITMVYVVRGIDYSLAANAFSLLLVLAWLVSLLFMYFANRSKV